MRGVYSKKKKQVELECVQTLKGGEREYTVCMCGRECVCV